MMLFWVLFIFSVLCLLFAESVATQLTTTWTSPTSAYGNPELARLFVSKIYLMGGMAFLLALVQRVVLAVAEMKQG